MALAVAVEVEQELELGLGVVVGAPHVVVGLAITRRARMAAATSVRVTHSSVTHTTATRLQQKQIRQ